MATDAIRRNNHRNALAGAVAGLAAAMAIGTMEWFSLASHYPLVIIPFATSIVLVIGWPEAEPANVPLPDCAYLVTHAQRPHDLLFCSEGFIGMTRCRFSDHPDKCKL
jgi:hypothetical protein